MKTECLDHRSDFSVLHIKGKSSIDHTNIDCHCWLLTGTWSLHLRLSYCWVIGGYGSGNWPFERKHSICFNGSPSMAKNTFFQSPNSQICSLKTNITLKNMPTYLLPESLTRQRIHSFNSHTPRYVPPKHMSRSSHLSKESSTNTFSYKAMNINMPLNV